MIRKRLIDALPSNNATLLIGIILGTAIVFSLLGIWVGTDLSQSPKLDSVVVHNLFADVDGDGDLDMIVTGEVIFNVPPTSPAQP